MNNQSDHLARNELIFNYGANKIDGLELKDDIDLEIILIGPRKESSGKKKLHKQKTKSKTTSPPNSPQDSLKSSESQLSDSALPKEESKTDQKDADDQEQLATDRLLEKMERRYRDKGSDKPNDIDYMDYF